MKLVSACICLSATLFAAPLPLGEAIATRYAERTFRIESETVLEMETTDVQMMRDGEPVESPMGGGGRGSRDVRRVVVVDAILETEEGEPTSVKRTFETIEGATEVRMGEQSRERELDSPLAGTILALTRDEDGDVQVEVVEGNEPDDSESFQLAMTVDALLPEDAVEAGDSWELDAEGLVRMLGLDEQRTLFAPAERSDEGEGGRRRRGGGGGGYRTLAEADWKGEAKVEEDEEDWEGVSCVVITFECEAEGDLPDMEMRGGRQGRMWTNAATLPALAGSFEIELEGTLYFDLAEKMPVHLEIEGSLSEERTFERSRGGSTISGSISSGGTFSRTIDVSVE